MAGLLDIFDGTGYFDGKPWRVSRDGATLPLTTALGLRACLLRVKTRILVGADPSLLHAIGGAIFTGSGLPVLPFDEVDCATRPLVLHQGFGLAEQFRDDTTITPELFLHQGLNLWVESHEGEPPPPLKLPVPNAPFTLFSPPFALLRGDAVASAPLDLQWAILGGVVQSSTATLIGIAG